LPDSNLQSGENARRMWHSAHSTAQRMTKELVTLMGFVTVLQAHADGFGIGSFGYLGTGFDGSNASKDFFKYDPALDTWSDIGFSGNKRYSAVTFVYQDKAYLVTGINSGATVNDFWVFDPAAGDANWKALNRITNFSSENFDDTYINIVRSNAVGFIVGNKGYISTGENGALYKFTWEYDFATDLWKEKTPFEGPGTTGAVGFTVAGRGFVATGRTGSGQTATVSATKSRDIPSSFLTFSSIDLKISGLSLRNCFEFSRPWPRRSPL